MLIPILGGIAALIIILILVIAMQPADFRISRAATMNAPAGTIFENINDLRKWEPWSPWEKLDPNLKRTYDGPPAGAGATYGWEGNKQVGQGRMTILESRPNELIRIKLEFLKPFVATNDVEFIFRPQGDQTAVEWGMTGKRNFVMKAFCLVMNMDKMVGKDFEKGLNNLKALVESPQAG